MFAFKRSDCAHPPYFFCIVSSRDGGMKSKDKIVLGFQSTCNIIRVNCNNHH